MEMSGLVKTTGRSAKTLKFYSSLAYRCGPWQLNYGPAKLTKPTLLVLNELKKEWCEKSIEYERSLYIGFPRRGQVKAIVLVCEYYALLVIRRHLNDPVYRLFWRYKNVEENPDNFIPNLQLLVSQLYFLH